MTSLRPALLVFLVMSFCYRIARLVAVIRRTRRQPRGSVAARPIFWVMTVSYVIFLGCCTREAFESGRWLSWRVSLAGLILYLAALMLREKAMADLGRFFSTDIEIRTKHQVIRQGFYGYVRHPLLVCMAIEIVGLALVFNAYLTLFVGGIGFYFPILIIRQRLEERKLLDSLGAHYRRYQQDVGAFWPRLHWNRVHS
jgi:protein-S-isoprenylcysteine O-methyltransferase Ste14